MSNMPKLKTIVPISFIAIILCANGDPHLRCPLVSVQVLWEHFTLILLVLSKAERSGVLLKTFSRKRGRPRKYGERISLCRKAANRKGWSPVEITLHGRRQRKLVKMFKATYRPAGGDVLALIIPDLPPMVNNKPARSETSNRQSLRAMSHRSPNSPLVLRI